MDHRAAGTSRPDIFKKVHRVNRRIHHLAVALLIALVCASNPGCGDREDTGPPTLYLGSDVCEFCKMIISDQNYAAASVIRSTDGRVRTAAFDDIGCLLNYQNSQVDGGVEQTYVADYDDGAWLEADEAFYILSSDIRSPMASGIIASRTQAGADRLADRFKGSVLRFHELADSSGAGTPGNQPEETAPTPTPSKHAETPGGDEATEETPE
jgi:copper chaperone NosL